LNIKNLSVSAAGTRFPVKFRFLFQRNFPIFHRSIYFLSFPTYKDFRYTKQKSFFRISSVDNRSLSEIERRNLLLKVKILIFSPFHSDENILESFIDAKQNKESKLNFSDTKQTFNSSRRFCEPSHEENIIELMCLLIIKSYAEIINLIADVQMNDNLFTSANSSFHTNVL
jgi:hypothetical protein